MTNHMRPRSMVLLAMLGSCLSSPVCAQDDDKEKDDAERTCAKAEKILKKGHPAKKEEWALFRIVTCGLGAASLAGAWAAPPSDTAQLKALELASMRVSDRRVLDATLRALENTSSVPAIRRAAMRVVFSQYAPAGVIGDEAWDLPAFGGLGYANHVFQRVGEMPITAEDRARILTAFRSTATVDPDPPVRKVAAWLLQWLGVP